MIHLSAVVFQFSDDLRKQLRKTTINLFISVCLSVCLSGRLSAWNSNFRRMIFRNISYLGLLLKFVTLSDFEIGQKLQTFNTKIYYVFDLPPLMVLVTKTEFFLSAVLSKTEEIGVF